MQDFRDFVSERLGTPSWAIFWNPSHRNAADYDRPITNAKFVTLQAEFLAAGGDPENINSRAIIGQRRGSKATAA